MLRRTDPNLMRGYDIWGPWLAKFVGKNDFTKSIGSAITDYYKNLYESKPLTLKQKIIFKYGLGLWARPLGRFVGWLLSKIN